MVMQIYYITAQEILQMIQMICPDGLEVMHKLYNSEQPFMYIKAKINVFRADKFEDFKYYLWEYKTAIYTEVL